MYLTKEEILYATDNGLAIFKFYIPGEWKVGKSFLNPFYADRKASCNVYLDKKTNVYKIKDFGDADFSGDCFFLAAKVLNKNCSQKQDFMEVLKIITEDLQLQNRNSAINIKKVHSNEMRISEKVNNHVLKDKSLNVFFPPIVKPFSKNELQFWNQYGITETILKNYNVVSISQFDSINNEGKPYTLKFSALEPMYGYLSNQFLKVYRPNSKLRFLYSGKMQDAYVFGLEQLPLRGDVLFITGGEKDVMSLAAKGFYAICFNSETAILPRNIIKRLSFRFKHITLLYDVDKTGLEASAKQLELLKSVEVKELILPLAGIKTEKDISDFFRLGKSKQDLMQLFCEMLDKLYEETMALLKSCEIDFNNPPIKPEALISINEVAIGAPGNLLCITGSEGSGKTNYLGGIISGAICLDDHPIDTLGTEIKKNANKKAVIIYDTEQSEDQLYKNLTFILKRANLQRPPSWFKSYCMVGMSRKDRMQSIFQSIDSFYYEFGGIHMIIIDGIADLVDGVNDEQKSVQLVDELFRLAGIYKTLIVVVLHLSPSGLKLRGHLGSEIQRKAAGILSVEKDENNNTSIIKALKVRDGSPLDVPLIQFGWDKTKNHHIYLGEKGKESQDQRKIDDLSEVAREIFTKQPSYTYQELVANIMDALSVRDRQAKSYVKYMRENKIIAKTGNETNLFTFALAAF